MGNDPSLFTTIQQCRICAARLDNELTSFAALPVAGTYGKPGETSPDPVSPLTLMQCSACGFVQLKESIQASFYERYRFLSGVAPGYKEHLSAIASDLAGQLAPGRHVLEIGASDGTLLDYLRSFGFSVAGF